MTSRTTVSSFRRITPAIVASARLALSDELPDTTKAEVALLLKKAAPSLGIHGTAYHVMDILLGLSRMEDWSGEGRPVVAISNAKLAEYTQRSERTVMRCIRKLVEVGIAAYRDSASGRRFVQRDRDGMITVGYGIDFTPARARLSELKMRVQQYQERLAAELAARREISRLSRAVADLALAFPTYADEWQSELDTASETIDLLQRAAELRIVYAAAVERVQPTLSGTMAGEGDIRVIPYTDTNHKIIFESNACPENLPAEEMRLDEQTEAFVATETIDVRSMTETSNAEENKRSGLEVQTDVLSAVPIDLIHRACREVQSLTGTTLASWSELRRQEGLLCRMVGLSDKVFERGRQRVGPHAAAAILATVVEKSARDPDDILKPEAYFLAMLDRAVEGKLNLDRSLYGLASHSRPERGQPLQL
ncbi:plasmid replication protein RepC [Rhizobium sp. SL86]|uniref:plasmid replication protein RepC n=1 Tax=Rhizobium sp. SL86 TaxID=2995148 RepID=UPI0022725056|nr:plasmid replication protein RepC [Rhizobium sp. SL86]MCY1666405.1 plasmid replication protein RepC [Rhizobium sp. SL86]